jgi:hypothetical protein
MCYPDPAKARGSAEFGLFEASPFISSYMVDMMNREVIYEPQIDSPVYSDHRTETPVTFGMVHNVIKRA